MNESGINFTAIDIKDEINLHDQEDLSFYSKKKLTCSTMNLEFNENNISEINHHRDLNNFGSIVENIPHEPKNKNICPTDRQDENNQLKANETSPKQIVEKVQDNLATGSKNTGVKEEKKKSKEIKINEALFMRSKTATTSKLGGNTITPKPKLSKKLAESRLTKPNLLINTDKNLPIVKEVGNSLQNQKTLNESKKNTPQTTKNKHQLDIQISSNEKKVSSSTNTRRNDFSTNSVSFSNKHKMTSKFEANKITYSEFLTQKVEEIFDSEYQNGYTAHLQKILNIQKEEEKKFESSQDELLQFIECIYEEKISKIMELNEKYDNEIMKLKDMIDLSDPTNVNNLVFQSIIADKENDLKQIEDNFKRKKEEGLEKLKNDLISRKNEIDILAEKADELKSEFTSELKNKILLLLTPVDTKKVDLSAINLNIPKAKKEKKKVDFNESVSTTLFINTSNPVQVAKKNTNS